jgi:hypothetical protein
MEGVGCKPGGFPPCKDGKPVVLPKEDGKEEVLLQTRTLTKSTPKWRAWLSGKQDGEVEELLQEPVITAVEPAQDKGYHPSWDLDHVREQQHRLVEEMYPKKQEMGICPRRENRPLNT